MKTRSIINLVFLLPLFVFNACGQAKKSHNNEKPIVMENVITSYSIHYTKLYENVFDRGKIIAAICGATTYLAQLGLLNNLKLV